MVSHKYGFRCDPCLNTHALSSCQSLWMSCHNQGRQMVFHQYGLCGDHCVNSHTLSHCHSLWMSYHNQDRKMDSHQYELHGEVTPVNSHAFSNCHSLWMSCHNQGRQMVFHQYGLCGDHCVNSHALSHCHYLWKSYHNQGRQIGFSSVWIAWCPLWTTMPFQVARMENSLILTIFHESTFFQTKILCNVLTKNTLLQLSCFILSFLMLREHWVSIWAAWVYILCVRGKGKGE